MPTAIIAFSRLGPEHRDAGERDQRLGEREQHVRQPHQDRLEQAARHRRRRGRAASPTVSEMPTAIAPIWQRQPRSVDDAREHVAAELVGAGEMPQGRLGEPAASSHPRRRERGDLIARSTAAIRSTATTASPMAPPGDETRRRQKPRRALVGLSARRRERSDCPCPRSAPAGCAGRPAHRLTSSRMETTTTTVGEDQDEALDHGVVALEDRLDRQPSDTVPGEDVLDHDGAAHHGGELHAHHRDHAE